jgi:hypothetical protein
MNVATLPQAKRLIEVFETLNSGQLQALYASGLLTDLRRCAAEFDPTKVDRDQYQKLLGLNPSLFKVLMGGPEDTDEIVRQIKAAGVPVNDDITQTNFPIAQAATPWEDEIELVDPNREFDFSECPKILTDAGLLKPTHEHALRFAHKNAATIPTSSLKPFIIFPHKPWLAPSSRDRIVDVRRRPAYRHVDLNYTTSRFNDHYVVAGVRPRKSA